MPLSAKISSLQRQIQRLRIVLVLLLLLAATVTACYTSLFSFGDSLTDTGNLYFISPRQSPDCLLPPYGQTHFHRPNGRCSDGRLILDFLGIVQIPPYPLAFSVNFWHKSSFFLLLFFFFWSRVSGASVCETVSGFQERRGETREYWAGSEFCGGRSHGAGPRFLWRKGVRCWCDRKLFSGGSVRLVQGIAAFSLQFFFK